MDSEVRRRDSKRGSIGLACVIGGVAGVSITAGWGGSHFWYCTIGCTARPIRRQLRGSLQINTYKCPRCRNGAGAQLSDGVGELLRLPFIHPLLGVSPLVGDREETFIYDPGQGRGAGVLHLDKPRPVGPSDNELVVAVPELLHERVEGEWSFTGCLGETRNLGGTVALGPTLDLPHDEMPDEPSAPRDRRARPSLDEVLALRADRMATVREVIADLTDERLAAMTEPVVEPGYPEAKSVAVRPCLYTILNEEWAHRLYAERDFDVLESRSSRSSGTA